MKGKREWTFDSPSSRRWRGGINNTGKNRFDDWVTNFTGLTPEDRDDYAEKLANFLKFIRTTGHTTTMELSTQFSINRRRAYHALAILLTRGDLTREKTGQRREHTYYPVRSD